MKGYWLLAFIGWFIILTGCGPTRSMVKSGLPEHGSRISPEKFSAFGRTEQTQYGVELTVPSSELFHHKSTLLTQSGTAKLNAIAAAILECPNAQVLIIAYTDNQGTDMTNVKFSQNQANRIMAQLIRQGIPSVNVNAQGNGPVEPVAPNNSAANRTKNRRVLFEINAP